MQQKRCQFKPFEDDEKSVFRSTCLLDASTGETRTLTALDDLIQALDFVVGKLVKTGVVSVKDINSDRLLSTYGFCASLFFEFCWQTKVAVNGREHRQYSSLRGDLQAMLIAANEEIDSAGVPGVEESTSSGSASGNNKKPLTPLELAELLCKSFLSKPVTTVIWDVDDPDEQVLKNVAHAMAIKKLGVPVQEFVSNHLHLPLLMHQAVQHGLKQIWGIPEDQLRLPDVLSVAFASINEALPAAWCGFAFDVSQAFADRHHFVEGTEKARDFKQIYPHNIEVGVWFGSQTSIVAPS